MDTRTTDSSGQVGAPPAQRNRREHGARDMALSMVVLAAALVAVLWLTGAISFDPGGSSAKASSPVPARNPSVVLEAAAHRVHFALRDPKVPESWRSNSGGIVPVGAGKGASQAVQVGWVTPGNGFVRLSQSGGTAADLVREEAGIGGGGDVAVLGTVSVDGTTWTVYPGRRDEKSWVTQIGGARLLITGSGSERQFRTLAAAIPDAHVITPSGPVTG